MIIINKIWSMIEKHNKIVCLTHINADGDAYASQIALYLLIKKIFPHKKVYCINEKSKRFSWWNQYLQDETADIIKNSLVIVTDTATFARINSEFIEQTQTIIKIDHHFSVDNYGTLQWIDDKASSASEMITLLIKFLNLKIDEKIAEILYIGIISDTNRFHYPVVSNITFQALAFLTSYQINLTNIYNKYYEQTVDTLRLKSLIFKNYVFNKNIIFCCLKAELLKPLAICAFAANEHVDLLANINGSKIWMMFSQTEVNGPIIGIFRSNYIKVDTVAQEFGGGGHDHYAGGTFKDWTQVNEIIKAYTLLAK